MREFRKHLIPHRVIARLPWRNHISSQPTLHQLPNFPLPPVDLIPLVYNSRISPDLPSDAELLTRIWPETAPPGSLLRLSILLSTWGRRSPAPSASPLALRDVSNLTRCSSTTASNHSDSRSLSPSPLFRVARVRCREAATPHGEKAGPRASPPLRLCPRIELKPRGDPSGAHYLSFNETMRARK